MSGKPRRAVAQKNVMFWERLPKSLGNRDLIFRCSSHQMKETFCKSHLLEQLLCKAGAECCWKWWGVRNLANGSPFCTGILAGKLEGAAGEAGMIHWQLLSQRVGWNLLVLPGSRGFSLENALMKLLVGAFLEHVPPPAGIAAPTAALPLNGAVEQT